MRLSNRATWLMLGLAVLLTPALARADITWELKFSNTFADDVVYGWVILSDEGAGSKLTVDVPSEIAGLYEDGNNFGIDKFGFNYSGPDPLNIYLPSGWSTQTDKRMSMFGKFDYLARGGGGNRQDPLSIIFPTIAPGALEGFLSDAGSPRFALHLGGFTSSILGDDGKPVSSHFAAGHAPAPGAALLGFIELSLVSWFRRRIA